MKVLLAVVAQAYNKQKLEQVIAKFEEANYHIHLFNDCEKEIQLLQDLPKLVDYVKGLEEEQVETVVILSNIREFVCAWYRLYNTVADDYIYYLDEHSVLNLLQPNETKLAYFDFYQELAALRNMADETVQGKIYMNVNLDTLDLIDNFLFTENRFVYIEPLENFAYQDKSPKQIIGKTYVYNSLAFTFAHENGAAGKTITIHTTGKQDTFTYEPDLMKEHYHFFFFLLLTLYKFLATDKIKQKNMLVSILEATDFTHGTLENVIYNGFNNYCQSKASFYDKKFFGSLLSKHIKCGMLKLLINVLLVDKKHISEQYTFFINTLFYQSYFGLKEYPDIYKDREKVVNRISDWFGKKLKYPKYPKRKPKHVAIFVPQLIALVHSPTLYTLSYVKCFKEFYPEYQLKIFVEDLYVYPENESDFPYVVSSVPSKQCKGMHESFLGNSNVQISYPDVSKKRLVRLQELLNEINEFKPELIFDIGSEFSILRPLLYEKYPFVEMSLGNLSNSTKADYYIAGYDEEQVKKQCEFYNFNLDIVKNKRFYKTVGLSFPDPVKNITRCGYNIGTNDFVMITVGNRLDVEITEKFVDLICSFLLDKPDAKWVIVGKADLLYLKQNYSEIVAKQIIFITYEDDLAALYKICDIYLNPFRMHGGFSAAMAMNQALPILTQGDASDVAVFVGKEHCVKSSKEYVGVLDAMYHDKEYKIRKGMMMRNRIDENFSLKRSINDVKFIFDKALEAFDKRK